MGTASQATTGVYLHGNEPPHPSKPLLNPGVSHPEGPKRDEQTAFPQHP